MNLICALFGHDFQAFRNYDIAEYRCFCRRCGTPLDFGRDKPECSKITQDQLSKAFNALAGGPSPHESDRALIASLVNKMNPNTEKDFDKFTQEQAKKQAGRILHGFQDPQPEEPKLTK